MPRWIRSVVLVCCLLLGVTPGAEADERRVALVVGVSAYKHANRLPNTLHDARDIAASLARLGFEVDTVADPDRNTLEAAVRRLGDRARRADVAAFYYAGHALEHGGQNWLVPVQADVRTERDLRFEALDVDAVIEQMEGQSRISLVILDSCRDNPFRHALGGNMRSIVAGRGLAPQSGAAGTLLIYATAPGTTAGDGDGPHSPFTMALLHHLEDPGVEIRNLVTSVRAEVRKATKGRQVPWDSSSLEGQFFLRPVAADVETIYWDSVRGSSDPADLQSYLSHYPNGLFAELARNRIARLSQADLEARSAEQKESKKPADQQATAEAAQKPADQTVTATAAPKPAEPGAPAEIPEPAEQKAATVADQPKAAEQQKPGPAAQQSADQKAGEAKKVADQQAAAESARKAAEQKAAAEAQLKAEQKPATEAKKLAEQTAAAEAQKRAEQKAAAEAQLKAEQKAASEAKKLAEQTAAAAEAQKRVEQKAAAEAQLKAEQKAAAEAKKLAEQTAAAEAQKRAEQKAAAEAQRLAEKQAAIEAKKLAEQNAAEEAAKRRAADAPAPKASQQFVGPGSPNITQQSGPGPQANPQQLAFAVPRPERGADQKLSVDAMYGNWCSGTITMSLSPNEWKFRLYNGSEVTYSIDQYRIQDEGVVITSNAGGQKQTTVFSAITSSGMTQFRGRSTGSDWIIYNRPFHRC